MQQRSLVIHTNLKNETSQTLSDPNDKLNEAVGLALSIDLLITRSEIINLKAITPSSYIGKGKVEELEEFVKAECIDIVIFNDSLTPIQQRNLELGLKTKVIDRTALILEIFGKRASTKEGRLQVELAAYEYQKSRLVRSWTHLERQRGGGGFLGGPGEKQIESDRRVISDRIALIKKRIKKVAQTREIQRKSRKKVPYEVVSLVGYTNAGKSTLFNKLTGAKVMAEDKLFATLDPTMRIIGLPSGKKIILSDTVGFISDLPTELIASFKATLEEIVESDIILHIRDISNKDSIQQKIDVLEVLKNLDLEDKVANDLIEVLNKCDLVEDDQLGNHTNKILVSAIEGHGLNQLLNVIEEKLNRKNINICVKLNQADGKAVSWLYQKSEIIQTQEEDNFIILNVKISEKDYGYFLKML